jgi:hypothetical protein
LKRLFLEWERRHRAPEVKVGLFGLKTILIPVQTVTVDAERRFLVLE